MDILPPIAFNLDRARKSGKPPPAQLHRTNRQPPPSAKKSGRRAQTPEPATELGCKEKKPTRTRHRAQWTPAATAQQCGTARQKKRSAPPPRKGPRPQCLRENQSPRPGRSHPLNPRTKGGRGGKGRGRERAGQTTGRGEKGAGPRRLGDPEPPTPHPGARALKPGKRPRGATEAGAPEP